MSKLQISESFKSTNSTLTPSATRIINRDLTSAKLLISQFVKLSSATNFKPAFSVENNSKGTMTKIIKHLRDRINEPWRIYQAGTSLCGPAVFFYCLAKDCPALYVKSVIELYMYGETKINDLHIKPSSSCKKARLPDEMNSIDWVTLASLTDSSNALYNYDSDADKFAGITLPGRLESWFKAAGYKHVSQHTNLFFDKSVDNLLKANNAFKAGKNVCLFLSAKSRYVPMTISLTPNHWAVMSRSLKVGNPRSINFSSNADEIKNEEFDLQVFTWGKEAEKMNPKKLSLHEFSDYYFGYVVTS
ncbi:MAG: hypothetical protein L3K25_19810 [Gammaproteobacteria bacterium]|nr:hypothetical protein [Gammaproteobacteria bacterium]